MQDCISGYLGSIPRRLSAPCPQKVFRVICSEPLLQGRSSVAEQRPFKPLVVGSTPTAPTNLNPLLATAWSPRVCGAGTVIAPEWCKLCGICAGWLIPRQLSDSWLVCRNFQRPFMSLLYCPFRLSLRICTSGSLASFEGGGRKNPATLRDQGRKGWPDSHFFSPCG
jgi:hypothetical protein